MPWRPHARVKVDARNPRAAGVCDRCSIPTNHYKLRFQYDFAGSQLQNLRILVCEDCYDVPQRQLGTKILGPDPLPIFNARPEPFTTTGLSYEESNILCQPAVGSANTDNFNDNFNDNFGGPGANAGLDGDGPQMAMPDGVTLMVMPANPPGVAPT